jgi:bifunctional non-homologous end joining protein LigD
MGRWSSSGRLRREVADVPGTMPTVIEPQLATAARQIPAHGDWSYEIKFDGYRMMTRIEDGVVRFITWSGYDCGAAMTGRTGYYVCERPSGN